MSRAIDAKSTSARATIAIRKMKAGHTYLRSFFDCFEMGDGDDVIREILRRAETDPEIERAYPHVAEWRKTFNHPSVRSFAVKPCAEPGCKNEAGEACGTVDYCYDHEHKERQP